MIRGMDKLELVAMLRTGHDRLASSIAALSDDELALPAQGDWTRRDVVAHIEWWERHSTLVIAAAREGRDPFRRDEPFDLDARNEQVFRENLGRSAADVRAGEAAAWEELLDALASVEAEDLFDPGRFAWSDGTPLVEIIRGDTDRHWGEHLPHLRGEDARNVADSAPDPA
jgi:hypothetical protein